MGNVVNKGQATFTASENHTDMCNDLGIVVGSFLVAAIEAAIQLFLSLGHRPGPKVDMVQKNPH